MVDKPCCPCITSFHIQSLKKCSANALVDSVLIKGFRQAFSGNKINDSIASRDGATGMSSNVRIPSVAVVRDGIRLVTATNIRRLVAAIDVA